MEGDRFKPVDSSQNLREMLYSNYLNNKYVDTTLVTSDGNFKIHSMVVSEANEVFKNLISDIKDTGEKVVLLPQFTTEVMRYVIEYLYRGDGRYYIEIKDEIEAAKKYFKITKESQPDNPENSFLDTDVQVINKTVEVIVVTDDDDDILSELPHSPIRRTQGTKKLPMPEDIPAENATIVNHIQITDIPEKSETVEAIENDIKHLPEKIVDEKELHTNNGIADGKRKKSSEPPLVESHPKKKFKNPFAKLNSSTSSSKDSITNTSVRAAKYPHNNRPIYDSTSSEEEKQVIAKTTKSKKNPLKQVESKKGPKKKMLTNKFISKDQVALWKKQPRQLYMCVICNKEYRLIKYHIQQHKKVIRFPVKFCQKCPKTFYYERPYQIHADYCEFRKD